MVSDMNAFTIQIPDDLRQALENLSRQESRPLDELVRDSLQRYVAVQRFKMLASTTRPLAAAQGFYADDDVFKAVP